MFGDVWPILCKFSLVEVAFVARACRPLFGVPEVGDGDANDVLLNYAELTRRSSMTMAIRAMKS